MKDIKWVIDHQGRDVDAVAFPSRALWSILERVAVVRDNVGAVVDNDDIEADEISSDPYGDTLKEIDHYYNALRRTLNELTSILDDANKE